MKITASTLRLPWSMIKENYAGEWVELVNCGWKWERPTPQWGCVRNHAADRNQLMRLIARSEAAPDATVLYVGTMEAPIAQWQSSATV